MQNIITVLINTFNEENNIADCIESAKLLTDTILVTDMNSTDNTQSIVRKMKVTLVPFPFSLYVEPARQFSIEQAKTDWVFILDADERITEKLAVEIKKCILSNNNTHYKIPRKNIFGKKVWLKHGGWWPDYQIRLIHKPSFMDWPKRIHSTPNIIGSLGYLKNPLSHFFHGDLEKMVQKTALFEDIESDLLLKAGRPVKTQTFFRKFFGELFRRLVKNNAYLDGKIGIMEAIYQAYSKTITYLFLYEKKKSGSL